MTASQLVINRQGRPVDFGAMPSASVSFAKDASHDVLLTHPGYHEINILIGSIFGRKFQVDFEAIGAHQWRDGRCEIGLVPIVICVIGWRTGQLQ